MKDKTLVLIGKATNVGDLKEMLAPFMEKCSIRYEIKGPIEVYYGFKKTGGCLILR